MAAALGHRPYSVCEYPVEELFYVAALRTAHMSQRKRTPKHYVPEQRHQARQAHWALNTMRMDDGAGYILLRWLAWCRVPSRACEPEKQFR